LIVVFDEVTMFS